MPELLSIHVSLPKTEGSEHAADAMEKLWTSAFAKQLVSGPIQLTQTNLVGDGQADLRHHGGPDKAVLCYASDHYPSWTEEYPELGLGRGGFGENFAIDSLTEASVCIGDVYTVGSVRVQVSQPRIPCWKVSRRWRTPGLMERVRDTGRTGWYVRVLQPGFVEAGMAYELVDRQFPSLTVRVANDLLNKRIDDATLLQEFVECTALATTWREMLQNLLDAKSESEGF